MSEIGFIRRIDDLGRVVIPKEVRNKFLIEEGDPIEIKTSGDYITLQRYKPDNNFVEMMNDLERRFNMATDMIGHKNTKEIQKRFKEIKELWIDTNDNE